MNKHILEFCENYFLTDVNPEYSVLLKGPWGCGKTHFVKKFENHMIEKGYMKENEILNLSIFGLATIDELEDRIFELLHPIRSSDCGKIATTVVRKVIEKGTNVDIGEFPKKSIDPENLKKKLIIIDDIERSELSPTKLLGYLSTYIIDEGVRIILICNEKEYISKFKDEVHSYEKISEKVIGYKFEIIPEYGIAIKYFCDELKLTQFIPKSSEIVHEMIEKLEVKNLRVIRRAIQSYTYIYSNVPSEYKEEKYLEQLFECYLVAFIQYNVGEIKRSEIQDAIAAYYNHGTSLKKYKDKKASKKDEFWELLLHKRVPLRDYLELIICDGRFNKQELSKKIKSELDTIKCQDISPLYHLMNNWTNMDEETFKFNVEKVIEEFKQGIYMNPGEILNFIDTLMLYQKYEMIPYDEQGIIALADNLINKNVDNIKPINFNEFNLDGYGGFMFINIENETFKCLKSKIETIIKNNSIKEVKKELDFYIDNLDSMYYEFIEHIYLVNGSNKYRDYPIMSYIDVNKLFKKLIQINIANQETFIDVLSERYGMQYSNGSFEKKYHDDYENISNLYNLYTEKYNSQNKLFNPKVFKMKKIIDSLKDLLCYMRDGLDKGKNKEIEI